MRKFHMNPAREMLSGRLAIPKFLTLFLLVVLGLLLGEGCQVSNKPGMGGKVLIKPGKVGIVFQKSGKVDPDGHFIVEKGYQGIHREVLMPGTHQTTSFMEITQVPMTVIPEGKVGILIALDGRDLPANAVLGEDDKIDPATGELIKMGQRGIRKRLLTPGTYPLNTKHFNVEVHDVLNIEPGKFGVLIRRIGDPPPDDQIFVSRDSPYRGIVKELVEPGTHYLHPKIYQWEIHDPLNIEPGKVGVLIRKAGDPPPDGQILVSRDSPYRGIIKETFEPGMYYLHPYMYEWEVVDAVIIPEGKIGVLTRKIGKSPPSGTILVKRESEYQGIIRELLEPGLYDMNLYEFDVQLAEPILIPDGFVGVMIARTGTPAPDDQLLVEEGFRGIRKDYLKPGLYDINPYEFDIILIDTRPQTYAMAPAPEQEESAVSNELAFLSGDGFRISIDATVRYRIQPENAPYVVATLGRNVIEDIQTKIIRPGTRSFARLEGSMLKAIEFASDGTRKTFQDSLAAFLQDDGDWAKITIINVRLSNFTIPEEAKKQAP